MKAFILCRQSATEGEESASIEVQEEACRKLCLGRGVEVLQVFREPDTSGRLYPAGFEALAAMDAVYRKYVKETRKEGRFRAGLGEILRRLAEVEFVAVYDLTRLHRPLQGGYSGSLVTSALVEAGVRILSVREGEVDLARFGDRLVSDISAAVNSDQLLAAREKAKASNRRLRDSGRPLAALRTIGLRYVSKRRPPEVEPEGAAVVRKIFSWIAAGRPVTALCADLARTRPGLRKSGVWYPQAVRRIVRSPTYAGLVRKSDGSLAPTDWIPKIVDPLLWRLANEALDRQRTRPTRVKLETLPLSGLLVDGYSRERMTCRRSRDGRRIFYWAMYRRMNGAKTAKNLTFRLVDDFPGEAGAEDFFRPLCWAAWSRLAAESLKAASGAGAELGKEAGALKARRAAMSKAMAEGLLDEVEAAEGLRKIKARLAAVEAALGRIQAPVEGPALVAAWEDAKRVIHGETSPEEFRRLLLEAVSKVLVFDDRLEVFMAAGGSWACPRLVRGPKGNRALLPRHEIEAELAEGHVPGDRSPFGMRLVVKYLAGGEEEKTVWSDPWTRIVVK